MVSLDPVPEWPPLSIQSGGDRPLTRWSAPKVFASRSKSSMNMRPMTARFFSGPRCSQRPEDSSCGVDDPMPHPELFQGLRDVSVSPFRMSPVSM